MKFLILCVTSLMFQSSFASVDKNQKLEGYVVNYDQKRIVIESGNQMFEIPVKLYKYKVKVGEKIFVEMTQDQMASLKKETKKTKKK